MVQGHPANERSNRRKPASTLSPREHARCDKLNPGLAGRQQLMQDPAGRGPLPPLHPPPACSPGVPWSLSRAGCLPTPPPSSPLSPAPQHCFLPAGQEALPACWEIPSGCQSGGSSPGWGAPQAPTLRGQDSWGWCWPPTVSQCSPGGDPSSSQEGPWLSSPPPPLGVWWWVSGLPRTLQSSSRGHVEKRHRPHGSWGRSWRLPPRCVPGDCTLALCTACFWAWNSQPRCCKAGAGLSQAPRSPEL